MNSEGIEQTLGFYLPGELMGLDALFEGRFSSSVDALETSSVCELPLTRLNELCTEIPNLQYQLTRILSKEISANHEQMILLGQNSAKIKMATFLLMLSKRYSALGYSSTAFNLSMRRQDIGNYLGVSHETISRQLSVLIKENIITVNHRAIKILDLDLLKAIIEPCQTALSNDTH
jgi:CRP/FNR family transcriptional regulator